MLRRFCLPGLFWSDHFDRCSSHAGVRRVHRASSGGSVVVDLDAAALADLRSDAEFYASPDGPDAPGLGRLIRSAEATLVALNTGREVPE